MSNSPTNPFEKRSQERRAFQQQDSDPGPQSSSQTEPNATPPQSPFEKRSASQLARYRPEFVLSDPGRRLLLVVCTANICRSPMIVGILQDRFRRLGLSHRVEIKSAGVFGLTGKRASQEGIDLLAEREIDISNHVARQLDPKEVEQATLVLVMEEAHRQAIFVRAPEQVHKVILFSELAGRHGDLDDPYRRGRRAYKKALATIDTTLDEGWDRLLQCLRL